MCDFHNDYLVFVLLWVAFEESIPSQFCDASACRRTRAEAKSRRWKACVLSEFSPSLLRKCKRSINKGCQHCPYRKWLVNFPNHSSKKFELQWFMWFGKWGTLKAVSLLLSHRWQFWFWFQKFQVRRKPHHPRRKCCVLPLPALGIYLANPIMSNIDPWASLHCKDSETNLKDFSLEIPLFLFGVSLVLEDVIGVVWLTSPGPNQESTVPCLSSFCWGRINLSIYKYHTDSYSISSNQCGDSTSKKLKLKRN